MKHTQMITRDGRDFFVARQFPPEGCATHLALQGYARHPGRKGLLGEEVGAPAKVQDERRDEGKAADTLWKAGCEVRRDGTTARVADHIDRRRQVQTIQQIQQLRKAAGARVRWQPARNLVEGLRAGRRGLFPGRLHLGQTGNQALELQGTEQVQDALPPVVGGEVGCLQVELGGGVGDDGGQGLALPHLLLGSPEGFAQLGRLQPVNVLVQPLDAAELLDQLDGGRVTLRVPTEKTSAITSRLLNDLNVEDLTVEAAPIEDVIESVFAIPREVAQ